MARLEHLRGSAWAASSALLLVAFAGCATAPISSTVRFERVALPEDRADQMTVARAATSAAPSALSSTAPSTIADLSSCQRERSSVLTIDPSRPLVVLVPGCHSSPEQFATLARALEAEGHQTVCFSYDDRENLERSARRLVTALETLKPHLLSRHITVLGHSQGGLIARRALVRDRARALHDDGQFRYELITVSSPFHGIESSADCGSILLHVMTLGTTVGICHLVAGAKWAQIYPASSFMRRPGSLIGSVDRYVKVVTDERDSCRDRDRAGRCRHSDYVFSLHEQYAPSVDNDARAHITQVKAGHTEIIGEEGNPPAKLLQVLEDEQILATTPAARHDQKRRSTRVRLQSRPEARRWCCHS